MSNSIDWNDSELYSSVIDKVEDVGIDRRTKQGRINEADFFAGAMAAMYALGLEPAKFPARWTLYIMVGRSPLDQRALDKSVDQYVLDKQKAETPE